MLLQPDERWEALAEGQRPTFGDWAKAKGQGVFLSLISSFLKREAKTLT